MVIKKGRCLMIPKIIHYCWFGGNPLPKSAIKCIESWKKYCPDYEIIEWNEGNFDISSNIYIKEAYDSKKFAFVTDYVRLYVMYMYGGIYMDTDVEVVRPLDEFLSNVAFSGFESSESIPTGIMASEKGFLLYKEFLDYYADKHFVKTDGSFDVTTNVVIMTEIVDKYGLKHNNELQTIKGWTLYPSDYFCPLNNSTGILHRTNNTATIHWFNKSWVSPSKRLRSKITRPFHRLFGEECFSWLKRRK